MQALQHILPLFSGRYVKAVTKVKKAEYKQLLQDLYPHADPEVGSIISRQNLYSLVILDASCLNKFEACLEAMNRDVDTTLIVVAPTSFIEHELLNCMSLKHLHFDTNNFGYNDGKQYAVFTLTFGGGRSATVFADGRIVGNIESLKAILPTVAIQNNLAQELHVWCRVSSRSFHRDVNKPLPFTDHDLFKFIEAGKPTGHPNTTVPFGSDSIDDDVLNNYYGLYK